MMDGREYPSGPYWEHAGNGHPFGWVIAFVLFVLLLAAAAVFLVRWLAARRAATSSPTAAGSASDALAVVRMRYARGEIDREQFLQASADLGGGAYPYAPPPDAPTVA